MAPTPTSTMTAITEETCGVGNTLPGGIAHTIRATTHGYPTAAKCASAVARPRIEQK